MTWIGKWQNQCGSVLELTDESGDKIAGKFRTAVEDSGFFGQEIPVSGVRHGNCLGLTGGGLASAGDMVVTYTGLLRNDKLETLRYDVADSASSASSEGAPAKIKKLASWRSMTTSADTFERVA